jgi:hypothetical protein
MQTTTFSPRPSGSPAGVAAFEFLRRTCAPPPSDRHAHFAARAAYWERVVSGLAAAHAVAVLTATYDLALWELDGVQDTAFARNKAFFAGVDAASPWEPVAAMAAHIAEVEAGFLPAKSAPVAPSGGFLPAPHAAPWSEWGSPSQTAVVPLYTVVPVIILQDHNGRTIVETA